MKTICMILLAAVLSLVSVSAQNQHSDAVKQDLSKEVSVSGNLFTTELNSYAVQQRIDQMGVDFLDQVSAKFETLPEVEDMSFDLEAGTVSIRSSKGSSDEELLVILRNFNPILERVEAR